MAPALGLLILGWTGIMYGIFTWLANPALFAAWILGFRKKSKSCFLASAIALAFVTTFLLRETIVSSEAPTYSPIISYGTGFWLWVASGSVQTVGAAISIGLMRRVVSSQNAV